MMMIRTSTRRRGCGPKPSPGCGPKSQPDGWDFPPVNPQSGWDGWDFPPVKSQSDGWDGWDFPPVNPQSGWDGWDFPPMKSQSDGWDGWDFPPVNPQSGWDGWDFPPVKSQSDGWDGWDFPPVKSQPSGWDLGPHPGLGFGVCSTARRGKCQRAKQQKMIEDGTTYEEEEGKWAKHYSSLHEILLVGEGDFSFSLSLANAFGAASNIVTTSLDNYDVVTNKYSQAKSNIQNLLKMGATVLHGVDATKMKLHTDLSMRKFDRIIFNFPHAGFHGKEDAIHVIRLHRNLVQGFFWNASQMLCPNGEVHVSHKTSAPYDRWNLEELASKCSLTLTECVNFKKADYPGYNNKRGDGAECDKPFHLGECSTFKFRINTKKAKMISEATASYLCGQSPLDRHTIQTGGTLDENQFGRARSFDGTDHLICYPQMSNPVSMQDFFGIPHGNTRISSTNYDLRSVRCEQMDHTIALPEIPRTRHWNLRHPGENDHSLSFHYQDYQGVTLALPVMREHFNHTDTINVTPECWRIFGDYLLHNDEMFGRTDYDFVSAIQRFLTNGYEMYMNERPEGTCGYVRCLQELRHVTLLRMTRLRMLLGPDD